MTTRRLAGCFLAGLFVLTGVAGCGGPSAPKTVKVCGKVTLDGKPLEAGQVIFQPVKPAAGYPKRPATASLRADGSYELSSFRSGDGVVPGEYQVSINTRTSGPTPEDPNAPEVWEAPKKYGNPASSGLTATVPSEGKSDLEFNFDLQK